MCTQHAMPLSYALLGGGDTTLAERLTGLLAQHGYQHNPQADLAVILDLPRGSALQLLRARQHTPCCLVVTGSTCPAYLADLWEHGIAGLVRETSFAEEIVVALNTVVAGGVYCTCDLTTELTQAERAVLRLLASGWNDQAIADALCLSKGTVMNRVSAILGKLGCANRTQAALWYWGVQPILPLEEKET